MLQRGNSGLVKPSAVDGKHKLSDNWEKMVHVVVKQSNAVIPVFVVARENGHGKNKTLHRNLLLPNGAILETVPKAPSVCTVKTIKKNTPLSVVSVVSHDDEPLRMRKIHVLSFRLAPPSVVHDSITHDFVIESTEEVEEFVFVTQARTEPC